MNKPVGRKVEILAEGPSPRTIEWSATLREDIVAGDPTSIYRDEVPVFHGLSVSGDVTGKIVYAGYGRKRDFEALEAAGVDVKGSVVLVKYGGVFRGLKIKAAQEAGAIGCLIFTDPGDDGEITVKNGYAMYPDGPARQESSVQRGSVQFISSVSGVRDVARDIHGEVEHAEAKHEIFNSTLVIQVLQALLHTPMRRDLNLVTCLPSHRCRSHTWMLFPSSRPS